MSEPQRTSPAGPSEAPPLSQFVQALGLVAAATTFGLLTRPWLSVADQAMINLLAVVVAASRLGKGPSLLAAVASVVAFDFCFVPPFYTTEEQLDRAADILDRAIVRTLDEHARRP